MMDKLTQRAYRVLLLAQEEARRLNYSTVGTEHILLGLIREEGGIAAQVLINLGLDLNQLRNEIERLIGRGDGTSYGALPFTSRAKKVLEYASESAQELNHNYIGTEHLLLGLLKEGEGVAAHVLEGMGVRLEDVTIEILKLLGEPIDPTKIRGRQQMNTSNNNSLKKKRTVTATLDEFGRDLTQLARQGKLDPIIGREKELERIIQILSRRTKNNPVLVGEPGVGKTAIVEGLAQKIVDGEVPDTLLNKRIVAIDMGSIVAGTKYRGEFEERMQRIIEEVKMAKDVILFIDEIHTLVGAGAAEGAVDAANILKPSLAKGEIQLIGATTPSEYRKYIEKDGALERRFQPIMVNEPTPEETIQILKGLREKYENYHRVKITDEAIEEAVKLSVRYITDRFLPDKAIDVIDEASARVRLRKQKSTVHSNLELELARIREQKEIAIRNQAFERAAQLRDEERKIEEYLRNFIDTSSPSDLGVVTPEDVAQVVATWTGIPVAQLLIEERERLLRMEEELHKRIISQDEAVRVVSRAIRRSRSGLKDPRRPIGVFMFLGPTGVGKTELARALAEYLFGNENALIRFDMSEFMEKHTVSRLIGAPPGYVGYEEGGQLTEKVHRRPYSVILFDEIEKAHSDVFNILLQIMDEGQLTDGHGRRVSFKNTILIMTSNFGAEYFKQEASIGFASKEDREKSFDKIKDLILSEMKKYFRPEFLNRLDEIVFFKPLTKEDLKQILELLLKPVQERIREKKLELEISDEVKELLLEKGYDPQYGARPLKRTIQYYIEDPLAEFILQGDFKEGDIIRAELDKKGEIVFRKMTLAKEPS
ncbi:MULTISPECIES: ATP-dependent Clp protease ATP-binding subunit [Dictyoglomus]|uniref:ATPase AAA-2 domain protein n=1 Tax=Dictyoglomus turgidum (strain DSM 6724 / Z-1310) TaxID=515635 RepID=B8E117_DICTD|nr:MULTISPECIES: ATP-dependent Clp protease ATP-binding subunit [Dictyoglomus]ACK42754.1 ATPase AAA-2 domain protein [Dictyoglomus turgidum DSM 6724]HBU30813.1 ATP-dependent Clp protease ATP-binding subunit [Dictyoglomus sp.]